MPNTKMAEDSVVIAVEVTFTRSSLRLDRNFTIQLFPIAFAISVGVFVLSFGCNEELPYSSAFVFAAVIFGAVMAVCYFVDEE